MQSFDAIWAGLTALTEGQRLDIALTVTSSLTLLTAAAAFLQAAAASASNRANFFIDFSERYTSQAMADALSALANWHHANASDPTRFERWMTARRAGDAQACAINSARRLVSRYYYDVAALYELGLIKKRFAKSVISNNGLNVFYLICDPLNQASQPQERLIKYLNILKRLQKKFGDGTIFGSA